MIQATLSNGTEVKVGFNHFTYAQPTTLQPHIPWRFCEAFIQPVGKNASVGLGIAICFPGVNYSRVEGRKVALQDAMRWFTKEDRTAIWKAYQAAGCKLMDKKNSK